MPARSAPASRKRRGSGSTLVVAFVIGASIVAAALIHSQSGTARGPEAPAPVVGEFDTVLLPVPVEPVAAGTKVRDVRLKQIAFPRHQVPHDSIADISDYADAVVIAALPASLPMFPQNLSFDATGTNPVLERIPNGMRAMTIKVDATAAVEGWAGSGSIVDVLLIERDRTSVVAEKVRILSAERSVIPVEGQAMPNVPSTVTILVSQEQCLAINTAIPRGRIAFALRGTRDDASWTDTTFTAQRLGNSVSDEAARGESNINGFVSFTEGGETRAYALSKGKWINTEVIPQGALVGARASLGSITRDHGAQNQAAE